MSLTASAFIFAFFGGAVLAFVRHPIYGLYSYMLAFYFGPGNSWWSSEIPDLRWSLLAATLTLVAVIVRGGAIPGRRPWHGHSSVRLLMAFAVWLWIQLPWALDPDEHLFLAMLFSKFVLMFAIVYTTVTEEKYLRGVALAHVAGCLLWGYLAWRNPWSERLEAIGTADLKGSAFASMHVSIVLAFAGFLFLGLSGWRRWAVLASIPLMLNAIILMATRGAFVGLLAAVPAAVYLAPRAKRKMAIAFVVLGGVLMVYLAHDFFWERMATIVTRDGTVMEASAASRLGIAEANLRMFADHPLGVGHRGNDLLSPQYMAPELLTEAAGVPIRSAHNVVLAVLVDHGLIGLLLILMLHVQIVRSLLRLHRLPAGSLSLQMAALCAALGTALVIYWVNAQFANMLKAEIVIWIAALAAALETLPKNRLQDTLPLKQQRSPIHLQKLRH